MVGAISRSGLGCRIQGYEGLGLLGSRGLGAQRSKVKRLGCVLPPHSNSWTIITNLRSSPFMTRI